MATLVTFVNPTAVVGTGADNFDSNESSEREVFSYISN